MQLSDAQIATAARAASFTGQDVVTAVAVALAESSGKTDATNHNTNGSTDFGLWQINSVHSDLLAGKDWTDPILNAAMAKRVHDDAGSWKPWSTFNSGAWLAYRGRATLAATQNAPLPSTTSAGNNSYGAPVSNGKVTLAMFIPDIGDFPTGSIPWGGATSGAAGSATGSEGNPLDALGQIVTFLKFVGDANNWLRVSEFLFGMMVTGWGLWQFVKSTSAGSAIKQGVGNVAKTAAVAAVL